MSFAVGERVRVAGYSSLVGDVMLKFEGEPIYVVHFDHMEDGLGAPYFEDELEAASDEDDWKGMGDDHG